MSADPWQHVVEGVYATAVQAYSKLIADDPKPPWFSNRGTAYLGLGQLDRALQDFKAAQELQHYPGDGYRQKIATVQWISGDHDAALRSWRALVDDFSAGQIKYTDGSGGLHNGCFLWFAAISVASSEDTAVATQFMEELLFNPRSKNWPGPIAAFIIDQIDWPTFMSHVSDVDILQQRQLCQAAFYAAVKAQGDKDGAQNGDLFNRAIHDRRAQIECEYHLAQYEARRSPATQKGV